MTDAPVMSQPARICLQASTPGVSTVSSSDLLHSTLSPETLFAAATRLASLTMGRNDSQATTAQPVRQCQCLCMCMRSKPYCTAALV